MSTVTPPPSIGRAQLISTVPTMPIEFSLLCEHLRLPEDAWAAAQGRIHKLVIEASEHVGRLLKRSLLTQTWRLSFDDAFPTVIELRYPPVQSVTSISYVDPVGDAQTLASYRLAANGDQPGRITPALGESWPTTAAVTEAVVVTYVAGYSTAGDVPADLQRAVEALVAHWYDYGEATAAERLMATPYGFDDLIGQHRLPTLA